MAKDKKIKLKSGKSKDSVIEKSKKDRSEKIEKAAKKKKGGKKDKIAKAEKPVKKIKGEGKSAKVTEKLGKKSKKLDEKAAKVKGKKSKGGDKPAKKAKKIIANDVKPIKVKQNRGQTLDAIIEGADLQEILGKKIEITERQEKKIVKAVMDAIERNILGHVAKGGSGQFTFSNLFKIVTKHVPAKARRKGINPFTKVEQWFEAKPATTRVKARPMKRLKDAAL